MTAKGGRKKGSKNKYSGEPHNLAFWKITLERPDEVSAFITRGSIEQKATIKEILVYLKRVDTLFFKEVKGNKILKELK